MIDSPSRVTVVVTNRNGLQHLDECFGSLCRQTFSDFSVVFVDNASSDTSVEWVRQHYPDTEIIVHEVDTGYSTSANDGIRAAKGEYIVLLNNDVRLEPDWLEALVSAMDKHPHYDFGASFMIMYFEPNLTNAAGDMYSLKDVSGINRGWTQPITLFGEPKRVLGACGGAAIYRRGFFDDVGLFDEDFYLVHEDTDINLRALIAGKKCLYIPDARVFHKIRSSGGQYSAGKLERLDTRNRMFVAAKNLPLVALGYCVWLRAWPAMRSTIPLRPSKWRLIPGLIRSLPQRSAPDIEGFRLGWSKRRDAWSRRRIGTITILWWLLNGVADVDAG
jgi:GT2 family glycosyltransferase